MNRYILTGGTILTFDKDNPLLERQAILIDDGYIVKIGADDSFQDEVCERIDVEGKIIMPGLINAHHHFYSTFVTGLGKSASAKNFNAVLENLWWRLDKKLLPEDNYYSALISILASIRKGTTTIIDHHSSPYAVENSLSQIAQAVRETGIKASLCYEVSDRDGAEITQAGIEKNYEWLKHCQNNPNPFLKGLFGLHAAFTLADDTLANIADKVAELNCGIHIHTAEAETDEKYNVEHFGRRVVERLNIFNLLNSNSILAHGVYLNARELILVAEKGAAIVTNPQSNLNNAVGIADVCKMMELGITVGLGTDAMTNNMLEEVRVGVWAQHLKQNDPSRGFMEIASALVFNNPLIAQKYWGEKHGTIKAGGPADIIVVDYIPHTPFNEETWLGHLVYGISQANVEATICQGKILMWNRELLLDIDEQEVKAKARELAKKLWDRF
ncbi:MAG: putative aminohydrolase SsnA [Candidatus Cloacimonas sp.]|nr:putative aminohydrolase SsnA [Candidatus Cloacimonas sp.]